LADNPENPAGEPQAFAQTIICTAADAGFFPLLSGLLASLRETPAAHGMALGILDLGLDSDQRQGLAAQGVKLVEPGWDVRIPWQAEVPSHYRGLSARPHLPRYFPGHERYIWLDADTWVQDGSTMTLLDETAERGRLAIVPELDRGYWTSFKPPKLWGQNQRAFAWGYGLRAGHRLGRNPILNGGVFALRGDAPHWALWAAAHRAAIARPRLFGRNAGNFYFQISEQTALNHVAFATLRAQTSLLPATANWFCGKGTPMWDAERRVLIEPHPPYQPLGIVHLAGKGMKDRIWDLPVLQGGTIRTRLRWEDVRALG
jgi:hypothetical protein